MMIRIGDLTVGERLAIERGRRGMSQREFAEYLNLTRRKLQELEAGTAKDDQSVASAVSQMTGLKTHEQCAVARSRAGMRVAEVARAMGRSRQWVYEMESGRENCQELATFWGIEAAA